MAKVPQLPPVTSRKGAPPEPAKTVGNLDKLEPAVAVNMNFKVSPAFRREFKTYAASHDLSMLDLLQEAFHLVKEHRG